MATCRRSEPAPAARRRAGFTLVEMLVVLTLVGLLGSVAVPRLTVLYASVERSGQRADLIGQIEQLGYRAYASGRAIALESSGATPPRDYPLQLPPGWGVELSRPLRYSAQGICGGGTLALRDPEGERETFRLSPPRCHPVAIGAR